MSAAYIQQSVPTVNYRCSRRVHSQIFYSSPRHHIPSSTMNFATSSLQALRSCRSSSFAARSLPRPAAARASARWARLGSRQYSEQATPEEKASESDSKPEPAKEGSELEAKLKAKEEEVKDLTVSRPGATWVNTADGIRRAVSATCKQTSSICREMPHERRNRHATLLSQSSLVTCWRPSTS